MQIQTVLVGAAPRQVTPRNGNPFILYELFAADGTTWVTRQDVFNVAQGMVGQMVEIVGRVEQKGNFTNHYADIVQLAGQTLAQPVQAQNPALQAQQAAVAQGRVVHQPKWQPTENDRTIYRQTAGKVAAELSTTADEFWANVVEIARYFETGATPQLTQVMAGMNITDGYQDDDVPF